MEKEDFKEVLLQIFEIQLEYQLQAIRQLQGKPETEPVLPIRRGRRRQSLVDLSVQILTEEGKPLHVNEIVRLLQVRFGRLADRRGRRPVMLAGFGIFLLGSIASGAAPTMPLFLAARALQGLGAGALMTTAFTLVGDLYDLKARAKIQGILSGVWGVAAVVGPLVGGTLVETVGWRWLFYINIPVGPLAASVIWGINTLFLLDAGLTIAEVFVANSAFSVGTMIFEIPTGVVADTVGRRVSFLLSVAVLAISTLSAVLLMLRSI